MASDLSPHLRWRGAAQGVAGIQRALQAEWPEHIGFDAAVELLQRFQWQL